MLPKSPPLPAPRNCCLLWASLISHFFSLPRESLEEGRQVRSGFPLFSFKAFHRLTLRIALFSEEAHEASGLCKGSQLARNLTQLDASLASVALLGKNQGHLDRLKVVLMLTVYASA